MTNTTATRLGATSTTEEVLSGIDLRGKRALVTGVSAGLGLETARALSAHGAHVVGAVRDLTKAKAVTAQISKDAAANGGGFELVSIDLADLESVRACADALLKKGEPFDLVIANAGVMATPFGHTVDGFETQFGTNHLGHFVLINRIAPLIRAPLQGKSIPQGAATSVWAGVVAPADEIGGRYCEDCHVAAIVPDNPSTGAMSEGVRSYAVDPNSARALWKKSEEMVGESF